MNLYSKDKVEIRDVFVKTDLDAEYQDAVLTLEASVRNLGQADAAGQNYTVSAELYESDSQHKSMDGAYGAVCYGSGGKG